MWLLSGPIHQKQYELGLTNSQLRELVGVCKLTMNKWRGGMARPRKWELIRKFALIFGCDVDWLESALVAHWRMRPDEKKRYNRKVREAQVLARYGEDGPHRFGRKYKSRPDRDAAGKGPAVEDGDHERSPEVRPEDPHGPAGQVDR